MPPDATEDDRETMTNVLVVDQNSAFLLLCTIPVQHNRRNRATRIIDQIDSLPQL